MTDEVCEHPYFSSQKSIDDVIYHIKLKDNVLFLSEDSFIRDIKTNLICGIK